MRRGWQWPRGSQRAQDDGQKGTAEEKDFMAIQKVELTELVTVWVAELGEGAGKFINEGLA